MNMKWFVYGLGALSCSVACSTGTSIEPENPVGGQTVQMTFEATENGDLELCDAEGECETHPNPDRCAILTVTIDTVTGLTCEVCEDADGEVIHESCEPDRQKVACTVVTVPDPDCVVCAYIDGAVIFSSCKVEDPIYCIDYPREPRPTPLPEPALCEPDECGPPPGAPNVLCDDGSTGGPVCTVNDNGGCGWIIRDCPPPPPPIEPCEICYDRAGHEVSNDCDGCREIACPQILCAPGFVQRTLPGDCCPTCVPVGECRTDDECGPGHYCAYDDGACWTFDSAADNLSDACFGRCRPVDPCWLDDVPEAEFDAAAPFDQTENVIYCEGKVVVEPDPNGCPSLVCVCEDGSVSDDGRCFDRCAAVACLDLIPSDCGPGFHWEIEYPDCCGKCVPDDRCDFIAFPEDPNADQNNSGEGEESFTDPLLYCPQVLCAPGFVPGFVPGECCPTCVPDQRPCVSNDQCEPHEYCTVDDGICDVPPGCSDDAACPAVCYGTCEPRQRCHDSDGFNPKVQGELTWTNQAGDVLSHLDYCASEREVVELFCHPTSLGSLPARSKFECPEGCREGACVE